MWKFWENERDDWHEDPLFSTISIDWLSFLVLNVSNALLKMRKVIYSLIESSLDQKNNEQWCWLSIKIEFSRKSLTNSSHPIRNSRKEFFSDSQRKKFDYRSFFLLQARKQTFMSTVTKFKFFFPSSTILQHSLFLLYI